MSTKDLVYIALFAALMAAFGVFPPIIFPIIAVPITLQSLGPMLAGALLGAKKGALAMILFCVLVAIGFPLLSGGKGGLAPFVGPTAGFIYGWIIAAFIIGFFYQKSFCQQNLVAELSVMILGGIVVVYGFGVIWLSIVGNITLSNALMSMLVFLPLDFIKVFIAIFVVRNLKKIGMF
ncbi:biotin transporter BioY [Thorsellia kenyensis]|uniref:Biotin transporter n=1 Tax=Thorsellia kenyensis TaxID=1549888 RepID=A0ABV6CE07_9GAMM